jgi:hypothetical protein
MSKAIATKSPNTVVHRSFISGNHCIPIFETLISCTGSMWIIWPLDTRKLNPGQVAGGRALGYIDGYSGSGDSHRGEPHRNARAACEMTIRANRSGIVRAVRPIHYVDAESPVMDGGSLDEGRCAGPASPPPAIPTSCRPDGRERGLKPCR